MSGTGIIGLMACASVGASAEIYCLNRLVDGYGWLSMVGWLGGALVSVVVFGLLGGHILYIAG